MAGDNDFSAEEIKIFLDEAEELLDVMERDILQLEENQDPSLIQEIFRAAHTLKGSSATLGHQRLTALTHAAESVLDKVRSGEIMLTSDVTDALLNSLDMMRALAGEIRSGEDAGVDLGPVLAKLRDIASGEEPSQLREEENRQDASSETISEEGNEFALEPGEQSLEVSVSLAKDSIMPAVRAYQIILALNEHGRILSSTPSLAEIEEEKVDDSLKVIFATREPREIIRQAVIGVPDVASLNIQRWNAPSSRKADTEAALLAETLAESSHPGGGSPKSGAGLGKAMSRSVRVDVSILDSLMNLVGELVIDRTRLSQIVQDLRQHGGEIEEIAEDLSRTGGHVGQITAQLQEYIMKARMVPLENIFKKFPRMVRDLAQRSQKKIEFIVNGEETELDRSVIQEIGDPLIHLLRNAVDHGIESPEERERLGKPPVGTIKLSASHREGRIVIAVEDDGRGIDASKIKQSALTKGIITEDLAAHLSENDLINLIFVPGFSTSEEVNEISGRGVGMDVVKRNIEKVSGTIEIETRVGKGSTFYITLPLTLAILRALLVTVNGITYAIPLSSIREIVRAGRSDIKTVRGGEVIMLRDSVLPLFRLREALGDSIGAEYGKPYWDSGKEDFVVIVETGPRRVGLAVDGLIGEGEVVLKSLSRFLGDLSGIAGATILGDGSVALIVDVPSLAKRLTWRQTRVAV